MYLACKMILKCCQDPRSIDDIDVSPNGGAVGDQWVWHL